MIKSIILLTTTLMITNSYADCGKRALSFINKIKFNKASDTLSECYHSKNKGAHFSSYSKDNLYRLERYAFISETRCLSYLKKFSIKKYANDKAKLENEIFKLIYEKESTLNLIKSSCTPNGKDSDNIVYLARALNKSGIKISINDDFYLSKATTYTDKIKAKYPQIVSSLDNKNKENQKRTKAKEVAMNKLIKSIKYSKSNGYWIKRPNGDTSFTQRALQLNKKIADYKKAQTQPFCFAVYMGKTQNKSATLYCLTDVTENGFDYTCNSMEVNLGIDKYWLGKAISYHKCSKEDVKTYFQMTTALYLNKNFLSEKNFGLYIHRDIHGIIENYLK